VQKVREAAARTQCQNNGKQIGLALQNFYSSNKRFPAAFTNPSNYDPAWAWSAQILPYMDQAPLYDGAGVLTQLIGPVGGFATPNTWTQTRLKVFRCPSDT